MENYNMCRSINKQKTGKNEEEAKINNEPNNLSTHSVPTYLTSRQLLATGHIPC